LGLTIFAAAASLRNATEVRVWLDFHGFKSPVRFFKTPDLIGTTKTCLTFAEIYAASFSAVVSLENGAVTGISWDEGCKECQSDPTNPDNVCVGGKVCGVKYTDTNNCQIANTCSILVYLAWVGTDAQGYPCYSTCKTIRLSNVRSVPSF
jgi:hypothetical protein